MTRSDAPAGGPRSRASTTKMGRRSLMYGSGALIASSAFPLSRLFRRSGPGVAGRFGKLERDPRGLLDLPPGFSYRVLQRRGAKMTDGFTVPGAFDGMGCFAGPDGTIMLMRNHELDVIGLPGPYEGGQSPPPEAYDAAAYGGVTRLVVHEDTLDPLSSNLVLAGTARNCSGGVSPWGWLSCEETTAEGHGYVFLCRADADRVAAPRPILGYGRYRHEAACIDPTTLVAYLTEDQGDGCLYRFVPRSKATPFEGRLQALKFTEHTGIDTGRDLPVGAQFQIEWIDVPEPNPREDTVRHQARQKGAASIRRGEGAWYHDGALWFVATSGGPAEAGQIFRLALGRDGNSDALTLIAESETTPGVLDMPDNVTVSPWGEVFVAEDAPFFGDQYLRVIGEGGEVSDFARNAASSSELAGICFSPDGSTLFVNIYLDGITLAVRGPFHA